MNLIILTVVDKSFNLRFFSVLGQILEGKEDNLFLMIQSVPENPNIRSAYPVMEKHSKRRNSFRFYCDCSPCIVEKIYQNIHKLIIGEIISCKHRTKSSFSIYIFDSPAHFDYYLWKKRDGTQMLWKLIFIVKSNQKSIATKKDLIEYCLS